VYTCLSHDIVAHELGHAVLDGLKPYYNEVTSAETAGFHEYIGDAIALTAALNHSSIAVEVAGHGDGDLSAATIIQNIAAEFGQGLQPEYGSLADAYLRNAANDTTMSDLAGVSEEHDLSCVPTGVYYDLLRRIYEHIMQDKDRDQSKLRVAALMSAATVTRRMMLRALDYCPPVDLQFEDYAEAVVRADAIAYPIDSSGFRKLAIDAFQRRELGRQLHLRDKDLEIQNNQLRGLNIDELAASTTDAYHFLDRNRAMFRIPSDANFDVINLYRTKKIGANDYRVPQEIVMEFVWREEMELRQRRFGPLRGSTFPMWCGGTAVFSREGNLLHYVVKLNESRRRETLARYIVYLIQEGYLTVDDGEQGIGSAMSGRSKVVAAVRDGKTSVTRCAAMRHHRQQRGARSHG
jgi:hypothetical protein